MQHCVTVKETIDEFQGYLDEAEEKAKDPGALQEKVKGLALKDDGDDDEHEENDDDDIGSDVSIDYTPKEIAIVKVNVQLMRIALNTMKSALGVATDVTDSAYSSASNLLPQSSDTVGDDMNTVFTAVSESAVAAAAATSVSKDTTATSASTGTRDASITAAAVDWVDAVACSVASLSMDIIRLGSELYPPFAADDEIATVETLFAAAKARLDTLLCQLLATDEATLERKRAAWGQLRTYMKEESVASFHSTRSEIASMNISTL